MSESAESVTALSDDELRHDLASLKAQQGGVQAGGTPQQRTEHSARVELLEAEFIRRFGSGDGVNADEPARDGAPGNAEEADSAAEPASDAAGRAGADGPDER
jgi:hypothetical protein